MGFVVNLWGAPSSGKTTLAAGLFYHLKRLGINAELALEYPKELVWEGRQHQLGDQIMIFAEQRRRIERAAQNCDIVVCDCPILMGASYYVEDFPDSFRDTLRWAAEQRPSLDFLVSRVHPYQEVGRVQKENEAKAIHDRIFELLNRLNIDYRRVDGSDDGLKSVLDEVLLFFK